MASCLIQVQCAGQCWAGSLAFELEDLLLLLSGAGSVRRSVSCLGTPPLIDNNNAGNPGYEVVLVLV